MDGFLVASEEMGMLFESLIAFNRYKTCVEIGVAYGTTTYYLCKGVEKTGGHVYGFDLWATHGLLRQYAPLSTKEEVEKYLKNKMVTNFTLTQINTTTDDFKSKIKNLSPIDFAFIDGCHSYQGVKNDFDIIYPYLSSTGMVVFHDTLRIDGCREFIIDLKTKYNDGTFDIIDFPWGNQDRRVGISILMKRTYPICGILIDELCGSPSTPEDIYLKEQKWFKGK